MATNLAARLLPGELQLRKCVMCLASRSVLARLLAAFGYVLTLWWPSAAIAQLWPAACTGCHGSVPNVVNDNGTNTGSHDLGLGEGWMVDWPAMHQRVKDLIAGTGSANSAYMNGYSLSNDDAPEVYKYFLQLRDGVVPAPASRSITSKVNVQATSTSFSFTLTNFRRGSTTYTLDFDSVTSSDLLSVASHSANGSTGCSAGQLPAATSTAGASCVVTVTINFTPGASGTRNRQLTAKLASPGKPIKAADLAVSGQTPSFAISPTSWTAEGKYSPDGSLHPETRTQAFKVTNSGAAPLDLTSINVTSTDGSFSLDPATSCSTVGAVNVAANNGTCDIVVSFRAKTVGAVPDGALTIGHDAPPASVFSVSLKGTGTIPQISPASATLSFGAWELKVPQGVPQSVVVKNVGKAQLWFSADPAGALTSTDGKQDFVVASTCKQSVALGPGQECTVSGSFTPQVLGTREATLKVESDGGSLDIKFTGEGKALGQPIVDFPTQAFPDTVVGEASVQQRDVVITNNRSRAVTYEVIEPDDFKIDSNICAGQVGSSRVDLQACKLEYSIVSPK